MQKLLQNYTVQLNKALFTKDPATSDIGKEILKHGVLLLHEEGLEAFTFKKLAQAMDSTETTIYRYFQNKHQLLMYICSFYWSQLEWKMAFATANIECPATKLDKALKVLVQTCNQTDGWINEKILQRVVSAESGKVFDAHHASTDDLKGYYSAYHSLVDRLAEILLLNNPTLKSSHGLATAIVDTAHRELFYYFYYPKMNDAVKNQQSMVQLLQLLTQAIRSHGN
ncbi:MAG: TetR/AcrR family transcriptional regulator [Flavobacteriales bacterium]